VEQVFKRTPRGTTPLLRAYYVSPEGKGECCAVLRSDTWITGLVYGFHGGREGDKAGKAFLLIVAKAVACGSNCIYQLLKRTEGGCGGPDQGVIKLMSKFLPQFESHEKRMLLHDLAKLDCPGGMCGAR